MLRTLTVTCRCCSRLLALLAILSLSFSNAAAVPLSEYRSMIEVAIAEFETLVDKDGHESDEAYQERIIASVDSVRATLPKNQQIELEKGTWTTDNTWLHTVLDQLPSVAVAERPAKIESVLEGLRALRDRVKDLESAQKVDEHKGAAKQKLEGILARPDYASASKGPNALQRLLRDFIRWIESWLPGAPEIKPGRANFISNVVLIGIVVVAVSIISYVAWLLRKRFKRPPKPKTRKKREARIVLGERLRPEETATDLLSEAEALARSGDLRAAIRKGYIALLVELGDRNLISLAQYKTNRDYLRSVSSRPHLHSPLKKLTESFERHWYGYAQATPNDWQEFRAGYRDALETGN